MLKVQLQSCLGISISKLLDVIALSLKRLSASWCAVIDCCTVLCQLSPSEIPTEQDVGMYFHVS